MTHPYLACYDLTPTDPRQDYAWNGLQGNDDDICTQDQGEDLTSAEHGCDCAGCRCSGDWPPRTSTALLTSDGPPTGSTVVSEQICLSTILGSSRYVMMMSDDG